MIGIYRKQPDVKFPFRANESAVGYDLFCYHKSETGRPSKLLIPPGTSRAIPTGLIIVPPEGYSIFICSRSGMALKNNLFVTNAPGVIDPDYRGEIMVILYNGGHESFYVEHDERVGQMILLPFKSFNMHELTKLDETARGDKGFGSTGR